MGRPKKKNQPQNPGQPMDGSELPAHPSIRAASIATPDKRGQLLLFADYAPNSQWQPPQMAFNKLTFTIPGRLHGRAGLRGRPRRGPRLDTKERSGWPAACT